MNHTSIQLGVHWLKPESFKIEPHMTANGTMWISLSWDDGEVTFFCETRRDFEGVCAKLGLRPPTEGIRVLSLEDPAELHHTLKEILD